MIPTHQPTPSVSPGGAVVVALIGPLRLGLPLAVVERAVRAVEVTALPGAPAAVRGVIDVRGAVVPVFDVRRRFGLPPRPVRAADHFLLAHTARRRVALHVDEVTGLTDEAEGAWLSADGPPSDAAGIAGVLRRHDDLIFVHDLERFLSAEDEVALAAALAPEHR